MGKNQDKKTTDPAGPPEVIDNIKSTCFEIAQEYINTLDDPEDIKNNNGLFVDMLKYIYEVYISGILNNKHNTGVRYDYKLLNKIFNIYTSLVYKYKQNKRPSILEYSLFINIDRHTLYNIYYGISKKATQEDIHNVKQWFLECENGLTNGSGVFEIFLLKAQYRYNDNLSPVPIDQQGPALTYDQLPDLNIQKIAKKDTKTENKDDKKPL